MDDLLSALRARRGGETRLFYPAPAPAAGAPRFLLLVPVYRELDNGNLARFFGSVEAAGGAAADVDLFFLVNNGPEAASARDEAFGENQRTIAFLRERGAGPGRVSVLDLSTAGFEKNMGKLRQAGLDAWRERTGAAELARTVVVHLDADVKLPAGFFGRLGRLYGSYPELGAAFFRRDYDLRGVPAAELLFTHHRYRLRKALFDFTNVRNFLSEGLATYQLSARFLAHEEAGGFPPLAKDEDSVFTQALCAKVWWAHVADLELITEDRTRAEGFNSARRGRDLREAGAPAGWWRKLRRLWRGEKTGAFAAVEALRPPPPKDFFLQFGLFEPLAKEYNRAVREGRLSFAEASAGLGARIEKVLGTPVPVAATAFAKTAPAELPDEAYVPGTGGSILPPVAHPYAACLLSSTLTPGTDLRGIFGPHLSEAEQKAFSELADAELKKNSLDAEERRTALERFFAGGAPGGSRDPFLAWVGSAPELFLPTQKAILDGRLSAREAVEEFSRVFPDYLSEGGSFAREAAYARALTRVLAHSQSLTEAPGAADATALLRL
jgi:hypothetical protein